MYKYHEPVKSRSPTVLLFELTLCSTRESQSLMRSSIIILVDLILISDGLNIKKNTNHGNLLGNISDFLRDHLCNKFPQEVDYHISVGTFVFHIHMLQSTFQMQSSYSTHLDNNKIQISSI